MWAVGNWIVEVVFIVHAAENGHPDTVIANPVDQTVGHDRVQEVRVTHHADDPRLETVDEDNFR